ncbi:MAG: hypothetical protein CML98_04240 [Rhodobiaceae bacterium]|nr:hypothetical protein [Rhodobiaceae bacterium]|tara:strand:- start:479 stop:1537 length:1059 start_codon:yes stop_codon:yes gene_type:complete
MNTQTTYRRLNVPSDVKKLFNDYSLSISGLMTGAASNAKIAKNLNYSNKEILPAVILHHLPDKQISAVINKDNAAETINRQYIEQLAELSKKFNLTDKLKTYNGCKFSSAGCRKSCLVFSGRSNIFKAVQYARGRRTLAAIDRPAEYVRGLIYSIAHHAKKTAGPLSCRLKGTDENNLHFKKVLLSVNEINNINSYYGLNIDYSNKPRTISEIFKNDSIIFYEYSKAPISYLKRLTALNIDVTASLVADRPTGAADAITAVKSGYRLAVPIALNKAGYIPRRVIISDDTGRRVSIKCYNGDLFDYRPANPQKNTGIILKAKKSAGGDILSAFFIADKLGPQTIGGGHIELIY